MPQPTHPMQPLVIDDQGVIRKVQIYISPVYPPEENE